jgi:hypothetical protein
LEPLAAFKQVQWDAVETTIGRHSVLMFDMVTPRESAKCLVWAAPGGRLFQASAWNSYSQPLAERLLDHCAALDLSTLVPGKVTVCEAGFQPNGNFETVVIAPPEIALFEHLPGNLQSSMHLVVPAYRSEFTDGMSAKDFRHQIGRKDGWRVPVYRWNRVEKTSPSWE